jgi:catechol 2,3-dioxygenase-like lactoylglutathione lyase family enzyme
MTARFDAIGLVVADVARSLAFYRMLGVEIPDDVDAQQHVEATLPGGVRMLWDTVEMIQSFDSEWTPPSGGQRIGLAFLCDGPAEVDSTYAQLVGAGYEGHKEPWDAVWGQRYATVRDPDGNGVDLFAPLDAT